MSGMTPGRRTSRWSTLLRDELTRVRDTAGGTGPTGRLAATARRTRYVGAVVVTLLVALLDLVWPVWLESRAGAPTSALTPRRPGDDETPNH